MALALKVEDLTEWTLEETDLYSIEELSPEMVSNSGGVCIRGGRGEEGLTQKQLAQLTGIAQHHIAEWRTASAPSARKRPRTGCSSQH